MFKRVTKVNKEGRGKTESLPSIEPEDCKKLSRFFKQKMASAPDPEALQENFIFNLIYRIG